MKRAGRAIVHLIQLRGLPAKIVRRLQSERDQREQVQKNTGETNGWPFALAGGPASRSNDAAEDRDSHKVCCEAGIENQCLDAEVIPNQKTNDSQRQRDSGKVTEKIRLRSDRDVQQYG